MLRFMVRFMSRLARAPLWPRPAPLFVLLSYLLLSLVPWVPLLLGRPVPELDRILAVELLVWLAVWGIFQRPAWFNWMLIPALLALPTELYLFMYYGQGISIHHLGIIAESSTLPVPGLGLVPPKAAVTAASASTMPAPQPPEQAPGNGRAVLLSRLSTAAGLSAVGATDWISATTPAT